VCIKLNDPSENAVEANALIFKLFSGQSRQSNAYRVILMRPALFQKKLIQKIFNESESSQPGYSCDNSQCKF